MNRSARIWLAAVLFFIGHPGVVAFERHRAFERITESKALRNAKGVVAGDFNGDGRVDVATYSQSKIGLLLQQIGGTGWDLVIVTPRHVLDTMVSFLANRDNAADFLLAGDGLTSLQVYTGGSGNRLNPRWEYSLQEPFDRLFIADINSDGSNDIAIWSRHKTGVDVFLGKGNGMFARPVTFLADVAVGTLFISDLDGDNVTDVAVTDWVTNSLAVYHGFGKMKFSEPFVLGLESEPSQIRFLPGTPETPPALLLASPSEQRVDFFTAESNGAYRLTKSERIPPGPVTMYVNDFNRDGRDEALIYSPSASLLQVWFPAQGTNSEESIPYATGRNTISSAPLVSRSGSCDGIALLDSSVSMVRVLWCPGTTFPSADDRCFAIGSTPISVLTIPAKSGRFRDVIVVNAGSGDLSFFEHTSSGLRGSISIPSPFGVGRTVLVQRDSADVDIISSHSGADSILITSIDALRSSSVSYAIPTETKATVVAAFFSDQNRRLRMYTLSAEPGQNTRTLTMYDQLNAGRFLERSLPMPGQILDGTVLDVNRDGIPDVVTLEALAAGRGTGLVAHEITLNHNALPSRFLVKVHDEELRGGFLWQQDMNRDGSADLLVYGEAPDASLRLMINRGDTTFSFPTPITAERISISSYGDVQTRDLNRDGYPDIIVINARTKTLEMYLSSRNTVFQGPIRLLSSEGVTAFTIDDIDHDGVFEALIADGQRGYLRIIRLKGAI